MKARGKQRGGNEGPSQRQLRAAELVRHALVQLLAREGLRDPELVGVSITVGEVRASPDLKHMNVFVSPLGAVGDSRAIAAALNRASGFLRGRLGREIELRFTPELNFLPDLSYEEARHIDELLDSERVRKDLEDKG
ncbi:MAG: 30S ribosome-binding factor RbfA [Terricaulis sp.]